MSVGQGRKVCWSPAGLLTKGLHGLGASGPTPTPRRRAISCQERFRTCRFAWTTLRVDYMLTRPTMILRSVGKEDTSVKLMTRASLRFGRHPRGKWPASIGIPTTIIGLRNNSALRERRGQQAGNLTVWITVANLLRSRHAAGSPSTRPKPARHWMSAVQLLYEVQNKLSFRDMCVYRRATRLLHPAINSPPS
jgi:hypothetical protein